MVIDNKNSIGSRVSVRLDDVLTDLLEIALPESQTVRRYIAGLIAIDEVTDTYDARMAVYRKIVKPSIIKQYDKNFDGQMDIEDL